MSTHERPTPRRRTKIVATIGPASESPETLEALLEAGVDVARLNCAHETPHSLPGRVSFLRELSRRKGVSLAILADLGGPKLRIGKLRSGALELAPGREFVLTTESLLGNEERASVDYPNLPSEVKPGEPIYLNDGIVRLRVLEVRGNEIRTRVEQGGWVRDGNGLNLPRSELRAEALTPRDREALDALRGTPVDYVGLSFVRSAADIARLRHELEKRRLQVPIVAKIEKAQAVSALGEILDAADAAMVARGDLGVECPLEETPVLQKRIVRECHARARPVVTATQMLESMTHSARPTRAEATDVANAALDGTDAVMLSAETAIGAHPVRAVETMREILVRAAAFALEVGWPPRATGERLATEDAVSQSACSAARAVGAGSIVCLTQSGLTARLVASWRPRGRILAATPNESTYHRLALVWGVEPVLVPAFGKSFDESCEAVLAFLRDTGRVSRGETVVLTAGLPFSAGRRANTVRIETA
ncbi:MAG: pyruvate kinase [Candidatus Binatia bacterium]|nr:MAG: pyruvate kinase [Candidatus Binatia bacterium]